MSIKLYGYWRSSASYRVRIALHLKDLPFRNVPVSLVADVSEQRQDDYRSRNPQMLVPFLEDGNVKIAQSMAMLEYLDETYPDIPLLPKSEPLRSKVRAFCNMIACDIHPLQNLRVLQFVNSEFGTSAKSWATHWTRQGYKALESLCSEGPYVFGDSLTLADLMLVPQMYNSRRIDMPLDDFPRLVAVVDSCNKLAAFQHAAPEAQPDAQ